jgi:hypothetical protein
MIPIPFWHCWETAPTKGIKSPTKLIKMKIIFFDFRELNVRLVMVDFRVCKKSKPLIQVFMSKKKKKNSAVTLWRWEHHCNTVKLPEHPCQKSTAVRGKHVTQQLSERVTDGNNLWRRLNKSQSIQAVRLGRSSVPVSFFFLSGRACFWGGKKFLKDHRQPSP